MKRMLTALTAVLVAVLLTSCIRPPWQWTGCFFDSSVCTEISHDTMTQIVDALNTQDAAALEDVFAPWVRAEYERELDEWVAYLLAQFPHGDVVWQDPDEEPHAGPRSNDGGRLAVGMSSRYRVTSGGEEYVLYFRGVAESEIDPDDVGVDRMTITPWTGEDVYRDSNLDAARRSWSVNLNFSLGAGVFMVDDGEAAAVRVAQVVDALNAQDVAALRAMFTSDAVAADAPGIDEALALLLAQFPNRDVVVVPEDPGRTTHNARFFGDEESVLLASFYRVRSAGVDYRLFVAEFTESVQGAGGMGVVAIGATPIEVRVNEVPEAYFYDWTSTFGVEGRGVPGTYLPEEWIR